MFTLMHYFPYLLGAGLVILTLIVMFGDGDARKTSNYRPPRQQYYRWDDSTSRRD